MLSTNKPNAGGEGKLKQNSNWTNEWMQLSKQKLESLLGILPPLSQEVSAVLETVQASYTIWTSYSTIFPNNALGHRNSCWQQTMQLNHQAHIPLSISDFVGIPLNPSVNRDDLTMQTQVIQFIEPLWCIRNSTRCWDDIKRGKRKRPYPQGCLNLEDKRDASKFKARSPEWVP